MTKTTPFIVPHCLEDVEILFRDDDFLVVNKPSGLLSVPGRLAENKDCLITRLQEQDPSAMIVHRLDMDTSGIMVIALNRDSHRQLSRQFEQRQTKKTYRANVFGIVKDDHASIDLPIITDWPNRPKQKVDFNEGKSALTHYQVLDRENTKNITKLLLTPITGRSHQLRIHLAEIGHPILGCNFYAHHEAKIMSQRLMLHACYLGFYHPSNNTWLDFKCEASFETPNN